MRQRRDQDSLRGVEAGQGGRHFEAQFGESRHQVGAVEAGFDLFKGENVSYSVIEFKVSCRIHR